MERILLHNISIPTIGFTMKKENIAAFPVIIEALELGGRHFEIPLENTSLWENIAAFPVIIEALKLGARHFEIPLENQSLWASINDYLAKKDRYYNNKPGKRQACQELFLSTTIHLKTIKPPDVATIIRNYKPLHMGRNYLDVIFLENPVGLRGSDVTKIYKVKKDEPYPSLSAMFERRPNKPTLKVNPCIPQNLGAMWKKLAYEVKSEGGTTRHIGVRNFSLGQIRAMLIAVTVRPKVAQVEVNAYNMQAELRRVCHANDIVVVAIHPFGNPHHVERPGRPLLPNHPTVKSIAEALKFHPRTVLLQYLRQCGIPFMFDLRHYKVNIIKKLQSFALSADQMNMLAALDRTGLEEDRTELDKWMEKDPIWPFYINPYKLRKAKPPGEIPAAARQEDPDIVLPHGKNKYVHFVRKELQQESPPKKQSPKKTPVPKKQSPKKRLRLEEQVQDSFNRFESAVNDSVWGVLERQVVRAMTPPLVKVLHTTYAQHFSQTYCHNMTQKNKEKFRENLYKLMQNELKFFDKIEFERLMKPLAKVQKLENFLDEFPKHLEHAFTKGYRECYSKTNDS